MVDDKLTHENVLKLTLEYGILGGGSAGSNYAGAKKIRNEIINGTIKNNLLNEKFKKGQQINIVTLVPDSSERYISKSLYGNFDEWKT